MTKEKPAIFRLVPKPCFRFSPMRLLIVGYFELCLRTRWGSGLFLSLVTLAALVGSAEAIKIARVTALGSSTEVSAVRKGLALDPGSPQLHYRLSQLYGDSLELSNLTEGVAQARRAVALNPHKFDYWLNLASACESIRDNTCATKALRRALMLCPMTPRIWWVAGNYYLRTTQPEAALPCFQRLLELSPDYLAPTLDLTLRAYSDPAMIFEKVAGSGIDVGLALAFADFMSANNKFDAARQAWSQVAGRGATFPFEAVRPYLEHLLSHGRYHEAQAVWLYLEQRGVIAKPVDSGPGNLVFNGGFEQPPLEAGFDWRSTPSSYVSVDFADPSAYKGAHCLRVDFPVSQNDEFELVYQILPVDPGQAYVLAAYVRSRDITSDSGPRLRVVDPDCSDCLSVSTESTTGTTAWHSVNVNFIAGKQTRVVRVSAWRPRSRTFPMDISGSFWLDDVSLRPIKSNRAEESTVAQR
jgi:tetratricopeptide (TPR) repeat protein